ncbi:MAG: acyl-CoA ligase (AMP-forming), exosortase A system-associated, partial [Sedimenticolaceae bacterium]
DGVRYVRSGDTVKRSADGLFTFIGRDDEMMKVSGYRISPQEIELPALVLKGIEQAVCFNAGENIILLYQGNVSTDELKQHLAHELPNYMQPSFIEQHPSLPLSANGKLDRALAKAQYPLR